MTPCTRPAPRSRKASCRAAAWRCCARAEVLKKVRTHNDDQKTGVEIVRKAISGAGAPDRDQCRRGRLGHRRQDPGEGSVRLRLRRPDRRVRQHDVEGHHRPDQGGAHGAAGRGLGRRPAHHHRGDGRRGAEEASPGHAGRRWRAAWAAWTSDPSSSIDASRARLRPRPFRFPLLRKRLHVSTDQGF